MYKYTSKYCLIPVINSMWIFNNILFHSTTCRNPHFLCFTLFGYTTLSLTFFVTIVTEVTEGTSSTSKSRATISMYCNNFISIFGISNNELNTTNCFFTSHLMFYVVTLSHWHSNKLLDESVAGIYTIQPWLIRYDNIILWICF